MIRAELLPLAAKCGLAPHLAAEHPELTTWRTDAFHAGIMAAETGAPQRPYHVALDVLPTRDRALVVDMLGDYFADRNSGRIPGGARELVSLVLDVDGATVESGGAPGVIIGTAINAWIETTEDGPAAVVLQHRVERDDLWSDPAENIELIFLAFAWMGLSGARDRAKIGEAFHYPQRPPLYTWSRVLPASHFRERWRLVRNAALRGREAAPGPVCDRCPVRKICTARTEKKRR